MQKMRDIFVKFIRDGDGVTAIEFAMLAVPFTYMLIGLVELSLLFAATGLLEFGTGKAAREIRTGDLQQMGTLNDAEDAFQATTCDYINALMNCNKLQYEVVPAGDFSQAGSKSIQFDSDDNFDSRGFSLAGSNGIVLVRTVYRYELKTPFFAQIFSNRPDGKTRLLVSSSVIQIEPFRFNN